MTATEDGLAVHDHRLPPRQPLPEAVWAMERVDASGAYAYLAAVNDGCRPCQLKRQDAVTNNPDAMTMMAVAAFLLLAFNSSQAHPEQPWGFFPLPSAFADPSRQVFAWLFNQNPGDAARILREMDGHSRRAVLGDVTGVLMGG